MKNRIELLKYQRRIASDICYQTSFLFVFNIGNQDHPVGLA